MNIVLVENDAALLKTLELLLRNSGNQVRGFNDPLAACALLEHCGDLDVLIVDYMMPELTAPEVLERVRRHPCKVPRVILISGAHGYRRNSRSRANGDRCLFTQASGFESSFAAAVFVEAGGADFVCIGAFRVRLLKERCEGGIREIFDGLILLLEGPGSLCRFRRHWCGVWQLPGRESFPEGSYYSAVLWVAAVGREVGRKIFYDERD